MRTIILIAGLALLVGCAKLTYIDPQGAKVEYTRFWTTADSIEGKVGDAKVNVSGQKIDVSTLHAILNALGGVAK